MKNFQQNLLIVLAVCLCGLCAWQWYSQTIQRSEAGKLGDVVYQKSAAIRDYTNSIATLNHQISEMDSNLAELRNTLKSNADVMASQHRELTQLQNADEESTNEIAQYKEAVGMLTNKLAEAYSGIEKQNTALKGLASQRDELVQKYNDEVKDRNNVVSNYNALAAQVQKLQSKQ